MALASISSKSNPTTEATSSITVMVGSSKLALATTSAAAILRCPAPSAKTP